jgi:hypothetical protein
MTVVDRSSVEIVAPPPEYIVKEYSMPAPSASIISALGEQLIPGGVDWRRSAVLALLT